MVDFRAYKLERIEADFKRTLNAAGRQFKASAGELPGVVRLHSINTTGFYYREVVRKQRLCNHATAGVLHGDLWQLTRQDQHVSVAYTVARDGTVYQLFPDEGWAYHLGPNSSASNSYWSARSVAFEVSNLLGLVQDKTDPTILLDTYNKPYCRLADKQFYIELPTPYRGFKFWASFTDAQYEATNQLVNNLCDKHKLPLTKLPIDKAYDYYPGMPDTTLYIHTNVRRDKLDFSPAFDLNRIMVPSNPIVQPTPVLPAPAPNTITVKPGDTLYGLAHQFGITVAALQAANPGIIPTNLHPGDILRLS